MFFGFKKVAYFFKRWQSGHFETVYCIFSSKLPTVWHISQFWSEMHKNYRYSYFYKGKSDSVFRFSFKLPNTRKDKMKLSIWVIFRIKVMKKWYEKIYLLKLKFFKTERKMKSIIRCIFILRIIHPNFMKFRQKNKL